MLVERIAERKVSREPDEGVEDYHFHPIEPRNLRAYVTWKF
jgi:hypothetical protein